MNDPALLRRSLEVILRWDIERVVVSHGTNVETDAKRVFRGGFPKYLPA